jgi:hypothetical protein
MQTSAIADTFSGAEPFLAGITPCFWSHVPLLVAHIKNLKLINGLNCLLLLDQDSRPKVLPLTKVTLVGTIVCAERRSNGSVLYVLDDGTGVVDCLHWIDNPFGLPSLTDPEEEDAGVMAVGKLVKIMGRIECLSIDTANTEHLLVNCALESHSCIREIHASIVKEVKALDGESRHWLACQSLLASNRNSVEVLTTLGLEIGRQVADRANLPAADDFCGEWRLFGTNCRCALVYKDSLLCEFVASVGVH